MNGLAPLIKTLGWGIYCASSWTWCIGMFLPVILLERYGWLGFVVFAIPNVFGCAGFGYVIRSRQQSELMVARHGPAMAAFSSATVAFHVFFVAFAAHVLLPQPLDLAPSCLLAMGVFALVLLVSYLPAALWLPFALLAYLVSIYTFTQLGVQPLIEYSWHGTIGPRGAIWLIPVMLLGFLLCPYLDLTFHRARQHAPSHQAFGVFGVTFFIMILMTCAYAPFVPGLLPIIVLVHIGVQLVFTSAAHLREIRVLPNLRSASRWSLLLVPAVAAPIVFVLDGAADIVALGKDVYLRFVVIYGLIAPAYVLLLLAARWPAAPTRRALLAAGLLALAMLPCYELGFFHGKSWLLVIPPVTLAAVGHMVKHVRKNGKRRASPGAD